MESAVPVEVKSSAAWRREAKPEAAVGMGKPAADRLDGEEASDDAPETLLAATSLVTGGCSEVVVTLPCLECPPRERGRLVVSVSCMLRRLVAVKAGPSDGAGPRFVRDGSGGVLLFLVDENEASLTGDAGRCCAGVGPDADDADAGPRRCTDALGATETTDAGLEALGFGRVGV